MFLARELNGRRLRYRRHEYSLTFDDGPTPGVTTALGRLLQKEGIPATFFVLGEHANDEALAELVTCGHRIGNHTYSHQNLDSFTGDHAVEIPDQITMCHQRIERFGQRRIPFRAPGGAWSNPRFTKIANRLPFARRYVGRYGWDIDAADWRLHRKPGNPHKFAFDDFCRLFDEAIEKIPRGIILLHDGVPRNEAEFADRGENQVIRATEFVIDAMRRRGRRFVPLKEPFTWF
jgi:peptidoglycan/xylan/chitin deacetylase (PgdA/CDA1 family)